MVNEYITLSTSDNSISKKFYAIAMNYVEENARNQTVETNIEGNYLITNGGNHMAFSYLLKLSAEMEDTSFGTKADLRNLWLLNNPNGTPTDVITLIDHYGISHTVKFDKTLNLTPLTATIDGTDSFFHTPVRLFEVS